MAWLTGGLVVVSSGSKAFSNGLLALPAVDDYELRVLSPKLLELTLIRSQSPDPSGSSAMSWDEFRARKPVASQFAVESGGRSLSVSQVGIKRRVIYAPLKRRDLRIAGCIYLALTSPLFEGETVRVRELTGKIWPRELIFEGKVDPGRWNPAIHVNAMGYVPMGPKRAMVGYYLGNLGELEIPESTKFSLKEVKTDVAVFEGVLQARIEKGFDFSTYQKVMEADFSGYRKPGEYRLEVPGMGASYPFLIDEGIAAGFARSYALGLYHQRCGGANELPYTRFTHCACHTAVAEVPTKSFTRTQQFIEGVSSDYYLDPEHTARQLKGVESSLYPFVRQGKIDVSGGHHDAGDYSKYTINSAGLIHHLVFAVDVFPGVGELDNLGIPESGNGKSDLLEEAKWEADFLAKMQDDDGGFYFLVYPKERKYEDNVLPDQGDPQVVWPKNTSATAAAVAALAQTGSSPLFQRQFPEAAKMYLGKANLGWAFLERALKRYGWKGAYQKLTHYGDTFEHKDEIVWAATEMYLATGDGKYQQFLKEQFDPAAASSRRWGWWRLFEGYGCAIRSYAFAAKTGRLRAEQLDKELLGKTVAELLAGAEDQLLYAKESAYGVSFAREDKHFLSASWYFPNDRAFDLTVGYQVTPREEYLEAIWSNLNYEAGCNPVNVTYLTGMGPKRQREIVHQYAQNDRRVLPPSGIPIGSIQSGFAYLNLYQKQLGALSFPPDGDKQRPYPFYDRWGDSFNVTTEFVHVNQARSLGSLAFLMAQTRLKDQAWKAVAGKIKLTTLSEKPNHMKAELEVPTMNLDEATIVWEARDREPSLGRTADLVPVNVGDQWIEAEALWPDGRRVFAVENFMARQVTSRPIFSKFQSIPRVLGSETIALFNLNDNLADSAQRSRKLTVSGGTMLDSSNLAWMKDPGGAALRFQGLSDRAKIVLPSGSLGGVKTKTIIFEIVICMNELKSYGISNVVLFSLGQTWNSKLEMVQDRWAAGPVLKAGSQVLLEQDKLAKVLTLSEWHRVTLSLDRVGYRVQIDDQEILRKSSRDLANWNLDGEVLFQAGGFDGWMDEIAVLRRE